MSQSLPRTRTTGTLNRSINRNSDTQLGIGVMPWEIILLAQTTAEAVPLDVPEFGPWFWLYYYTFVWGSGFVSILYSLFLLWMLYECVQNDPDRGLWFWIILIAQPFGACLSFAIRYLPGRHHLKPAALNMFSNRKELQRLEMATIQIGNPYHFIQYGDKLLSIRRYEDALAAFQRALEKEPENLQALWGAAQCELELDMLGEARPHLEAILKHDPSYKFGDVSLAYGRLLQELKDNDGALHHLEMHIARWRQPEACYRLAELKAQQGQKQEAVTLLKHTLVDFQASPSSFSRKHGQWKRKSKSLLSKLSA